MAGHRTGSRFVHGEELSLVLADVLRSRAAQPSAWFDRSYPGESRYRRFSDAGLAKSNDKGEDAVSASVAQTADKTVQVEFLIAEHRQDTRGPLSEWHLATTKVL